MCRTIDDAISPLKQPSLGGSSGGRIFYWLGFTMRQFIDMQDKPWNAEQSTAR